MVVGRIDYLPGGAAPNWVSPKQGSGLMARHAVTAYVRTQSAVNLVIKNKLEVNSNYFIKLKVLRGCNIALLRGAYSEAVGGSGRLARSTESFLITAEVSNVLREAKALL